jgi:hypothetical protein
LPGAVLGYAVHEEAAEDLGRMKIGLLRPTGKELTPLGKRCAACATFLGMVGVFTALVGLTTSKF